MDTNPSQHNLSEGSIARHVLRMVPPMAVAFLALMAFNLVDTFFVSRLGTLPLAAMGFVFPIISFFILVGVGIGVGLSSCASRAIGAADIRRTRQYATYGLVLAFLLFLVLSVLGFLFREPLLRLVGAEGEALDLASTYLAIWLAFNPVGILPMVANNLIRATGDTLRPASVMIAGALFNGILDPLLIFGIGPFPEMGIAGASLATGIARTLPLVFSIYYLHHHYRLLTPEWAGWAVFRRESIEITRQSLPPAATNMLTPLTVGIITRLIARYGETAVAGTAAGTRIEQFLYLIPMALGTTLVPILGQNWGSGRLDRVRQAWLGISAVSIAYSFCIFIIMFFLSTPVARIFSDDPEVQKYIVSYIRIVLAGSILLHSAIHTTFGFNALGKPFRAGTLTAIRLVVLVWPLAMLGATLFQVRGVFAGIAIANFTSGLVAMLWFHHTLKQSEAEPPRPEEAPCADVAPEA